MRAAALRLCEDVHTEVEFEWLRPWAAQGGAHAASHALYWQPRMARLLRAWDRLEARTAAHPNPNPIPYPNPNPTLLLLLTLPLHLILTLTVTQTLTAGARRYL